MIWGTKTLIRRYYNEWYVKHIATMYHHFEIHYNDFVIMSVMASQITSRTIVYATVYSRSRSKKHQNSASLAFVGGIHRWPVNSPHKGPVARKMFPFDDVIMFAQSTAVSLPCPVNNFKMSMETQTLHVDNTFAGLTHKKMSPHALTTSSTKLRISNKIFLRLFVWCK